MSKQNKKTAKMQAKRRITLSQIKKAIREVKQERKSGAVGQAKLAQPVQPSKKQTRAVNKARKEGSTCSPQERNRDIKKALEIASDVRQEGSQLSQTERAELEESFLDRVRLVSKIGFKRCNPH